MTRRYRPPIRLRVKFAVLINQRGLYNGEPLDPETVEFDHAPALGLREYNELTRKYTPDANDPYYIVAKPRAVHHIKTNGTPATSAGSDKHAIAKVDRLAAKAAVRKPQPMPMAMRCRRCGEDYQDGVCPRCGPVQSRPFQKRQAVRG